jgi:hypothetical protein
MDWNNNFRFEEDDHIISCKVVAFHRSICGSSGMIGRSGHVSERIPL